MSLCLIEPSAEQAIPMDKINLSLNAVFEIANRCLLVNGCNRENAGAVAATILAAERDGASSHGLFRLRGYVASLRSGKVDGNAAPELECLAPGVLQVDGGQAFSFEAGKRDNKDGGPPGGGELLIGMDPEKFGDAAGWLDHCESFFEQLLALEGTRLPGSRRYRNRESTPRDGVWVSRELHEKIDALCSP